MRRAMGDEWQGTHYTHGICWVKVPSAGGQLRGTASSLLLFPLVYSADPELDASRDGGTG